ncbi:MAG: hypothetical protein ACYC8T_22850 [Myxococcaceae bacterium]
MRTGWGEWTFRVGHQAFGFFPALVIREALLRATPLRRGGWLAFLVIATVGGFARCSPGGGPLPSRYWSPLRFSSISF